MLFLCPCYESSIMERPNSKGRTFTKGCAPSRDLQTLIVDETVRNAGDINTDYFPGKSFFGCGKRSQSK